MTRTALVTGGSGFIGSHLTEALLRAGYAVRVLDRRAPTVQDVDWVDGDLRWVGDCDRAVRGVDAVFHLAARIDGGDSIDYIGEYFHDNVLTTLNILRAAKLRGVTRFIHTSSGEVYGNIDGIANESHLCDPVSPYAASKYAAERAVLAFSNAFGLDATIVRPFNAFGERQRPFRKGSVVPTFITDGLQGKPLKIYGEGKEARDFLYVRDIVAAQIKVLESKVPPLSILNIASGTSRTVLDVAIRVREMLGSNSRLEFVEDSSDGLRVSRSVGDSSKLRRMTGWVPAWDFEDTLSRVIQHYREVPSGRLGNSA